MVEDILRAGREAGFAATGVASLAPSSYARELDAWLARGAHAGMTWMAETASIRKAPLTKWTWARSALVGAASYLAAPDEPLPGLARHVARYARVPEYHVALKARLAAWGREVERIAGHAVHHKALVDTSAVLERELAVRAGLGWIGKNTCLIGEGGDSWRVIGVLLVDLDLEQTAAPVIERCGTCRACLDACPTNAFPEPWVLDANRCLSYLTIEHRETIPPEFHEDLGEWLFGCDVCQDVCPWNRKARPAPHAELDDRIAGTTLLELLTMSDAAFRTRFRGTPFERTKRRGLVRNAILVAANGTDAPARAAARALVEDDDAVVRETARAALPRLA